MRERILIVTAAAVFCACGGVSNPCTDTSCPAESRCDHGSGACVYACNPECAAWQACDPGGQSCVARYTAVDIVVPGQNGYQGHNGPVAAMLAVKDPYARKDPPSLNFTATATSGATSVQAGLLTLEDAGYYVTAWDPPREGQFRLVATYPDAGLSGTADVSADFTPPIFEIVVPGPTRYQGDAGVIADERDPGLQDAWRRDETVTLTVRSTDAIDPATVQVVLYGAVDGGAGPAGSPIAVSPTCSDAGFYCGTASVDLSVPVMGVFRGQFPVSVSGKDRAGNSGTDAGSVPVTRWKWMFDESPTGYAFTASPAIGKTGTVYFGGAAGSGTSGQLFAVTPEGTIRWADNIGAIVASTPVGSSPTGTERIYAAPKGTGNPTLTAISGDDGGIILNCGEQNGTFPGALALGSARVTPETTASEAVYGVITVGVSGVIDAIRPDPIGAQCVQSAATAPMNNTSAVVTTGAQLFYADTNGVFRSFEMQDTTGSLVSRYAMPTALNLNAPALNGSMFVAGGGALGVYGFYAGNTDDGGTVWSNRSLGTAPGNVAISSSGQAIAGTANDVTIATPSGSTAGLASFPATDIVSTPLIGRDGRIYLASSTGTVSAWKLNASEYQPDWSWAASPTVATVSPNIDCSRDSTGGIKHGRPAVLYVLTSSGKLHAFVVDSVGIDTTAPWPRYQHDPRNTGNSNVSLSEFSCQ